MTVPFCIQRMEVSVSTNWGIFLLEMVLSPSAIFVTWPMLSGLISCHRLYSGSPSPFRCQALQRRSFVTLTSLSLIVTVHWRWPSIPVPYIAVRYNMMLYMTCSTLSAWRSAAAATIVHTLWGRGQWTVTSWPQGKENQTVTSWRGRLPRSATCLAPLPISLLRADSESLICCLNL